MTVEELVDILTKYDKYTIVKGDWEGISRDIHGVDVENGVIHLDVN